MQAEVSLQKEEPKKMTSKMTQLAQKPAAQQEEIKEDTKQKENLKQESEMLNQGKKLADEG